MVRNGDAWRGLWKLYLKIFRPTNREETTAEKIVVDCKQSLDFMAAQQNFATDLRLKNEASNWPL